MIGARTRIIPAPLLNPRLSGSSETNMRGEEIATGSSTGVADIGGIVGLFSSSKMLITICKEAPARSFEAMRPDRDNIFCTVVTAYNFINLLLPKLSFPI